MTALDGLIRPAVAFDEYATVGDVLPTLAEGRPAWVHIGRGFRALAPVDAVGHSERRRLIDLPLVQVEPVPADADPRSLLERADVAGFLLVAERHALIGEVSLEQVMATVDVLRADVALAVAHDLANALCALPSYLPSTPEACALDDHLRRLVDRLRRLAGGAPLGAGRADVSSALHELGSWLARVVAPIRLEIRAEPGLVAVVSPGALDQVVVNLVMNARDAIVRAPSPADAGRIQVIGRSSERGVLIDVVDDGPGIPAPVRSRMFEIGASDKGRGRGVGLPSARMAATRMGGSLELVETGPAGTRFRLTLIRSNAPSRPSPSSGRGRTGA